MQTEEIFAVIEAVRDRAPLVHNITNYVVMNNTANGLLALGASPAMVHATDEVEDFAAISGAIVVNIGTLSSEWAAAMRLAALTAGRLGKPWVLDPVGAGATPYRTRTATGLLALKPTVVRGNASEVLAIAGSLSGGPKGVDSVHSSEAAAETAVAFAARHGTVAAVTGAVDVVTDGRRTALIEGGHPLMARVTGLGCTASALVGACLAVEADPFRATIAALAALKAAGKAAAEVAGGPGSLQVALLDMLHALDLEALDSHAVVTVR
ncbi:hydroxyethylthiazole kinase [Chthonobacter rhizosphaerae]|uniref:hydroxyethylthiazole kinase n=1 Tax=Chthonobacter rhizosphaerae TaxID=2735553 RepID=UPI0015EEE606|nr:hydroxyethylthiazole kinase [Chthonobacter rhizosphaerae]